MKIITKFIKKWTPSDLIAVLAFSLALPANFYILLGWIQGPQLVRFVDQTVGFRNYSGEEKGSLSLSAITSTINVGKKGYDDVILSEGVDIKIKNRIVSMNAIFFVNITPIKTASSWIKGSYAPFSIQAAGETKTNELLYYPSEVICKNKTCSPNNNGMTWKNFKTTLQETKDNDNIFLTFWAQPYKGRIVENECQIDASKLKSVLNKAMKTWVEVPCITNQ